MTPESEPTRAQPLVSIVIPFLNAERFLQEAIDSLFAQTYPHWELLLVDDGSTDCSTDMARRLARRLPARVRYLEHEGHQNRGIGATRNLGVRHARGTYIAPLDSDDVWLPRKLEEQVALMETHPEAGMLYGRPLYWASWTKAPGSDDDDYFPDLMLPPGTLVPAPKLLLTVRTPCPSDLMLRRDLVERVGGFEESFRVLYEDQAFLAKVYLTASVFVADDCWIKYRLHPESRSAIVRKAGKDAVAREYYLRWLEAHLKRSNVVDKDVWRLLRRALWPFRHPTLDRLASRWRALVEDLGWFGLRLVLGQAALRRRLLRRGSGWIAAEAPVPRREVPGRVVRAGASTTLSWAATRAEAVEVRVDAPDGPLFSRGGPVGRATTGPWVRDRMKFYLQDVSEGAAPVCAPTLAVVRVRLPRPPTSEAQHAADASARHA